MADRMAGRAPASPLARLRTLLFVPGDDPRKHERAWSAGADAVILDLEDAVAPASKAHAREQLGHVLAARPPGSVAIVRINAPDTADGRSDLQALPAWDLDAVMVPKADPASIELVRHCRAAVIALIETAAGVLGAERVARAAPVARLMFGPIDLALDLGCDPGPDGGELLLARSQLVLASAAAGLPAPIDGPLLEIRDLDALRAETERVRRLGYGAKACIHPSQLAEVARVFTPHADEVAWARRVIDAYEQATARGSGVIALDGQMIDVPVARRAYAILERTGDDA